MELVRTPNTIVRRDGSRTYRDCTSPTQICTPCANSPPDFPNGQPFAMRALGTCSRNIEPIAKSLLQDKLMFDPIQAPSLRHAFEAVNAAIPEADSRLRHQILDRA